MRQQSSDIWVNNKRVTIQCVIIYHNSMKMTWFTKTIQDHFSTQNIIENVNRPTFVLDLLKEQLPFHDSEIIIIDIHKILICSLVVSFLMEFIFLYWIACFIVWQMTCDGFCLKSPQKKVSLGNTNSITTQIAGLIAYGKVGIIHHEQNFQEADHNYK